MNSRYVREIPLRILHRKVGDDHVTLLQACYDNPLFHEEDGKDFRHSNGGTDKSSSRTPAMVLSDNGSLDSCANSEIVRYPLDHHGHMASDYMHSLPASRHPRDHHLGIPSAISFQGHRKKRCRWLLIGLCCLLVVLAVGIGLLVVIIGEYNFCPLGTLFVLRVLLLH